jgi:hypothetical protein
MAERGTLRRIDRFLADRERNMRTSDSHEIGQPVETAPLEFDNDLTRRDAWMFAPLVAIVVALPIFVSALFAISAWRLVHDEASLSSPPATFASRWPEQSLPVIR